MDRMTLDLSALTVESFDMSAEVAMQPITDSDSSCPTGCACCTG